MKKIKEYQMMLNENRIPYLETQKSFLCESKCNSPANVANIMESCFRISDQPRTYICYCVEHEKSNHWNF